MSISFNAIRDALPVITVSQGKAHMHLVGALPCVICHEWGMEQLSRTTVHHCIHGRGGNLRAPDNMVIPLCDGHHQGSFDNTKIAIHRNSKKWASEYGQDIHWLNWVENKLGVDT